MSSRRQFVVRGAGLGAAWVLADQLAIGEALAQAAAAAARTPPAAFTVLTTEEAATLEAIAARIMPTTTTPGAREAGVIHFMDRAFGGFFKEELPKLRRELPALARRVRKEGARSGRFVDLTPERQDALLVSIEKGELFGMCHFLTMVGMFAHPSWGGNRGEVGWKLLGFEPHPKHAPPFGYYDAEVSRGKGA